MQGGVRIVERRQDDNGRVLQVAAKAVEEAGARDAGTDVDMHPTAGVRDGGDVRGVSLQLGRVIENHHVTSSIRSTPTRPDGMSPLHAS